MKRARDTVWCTWPRPWGALLVASALSAACAAREGWPAAYEPAPRPDGRLATSVTPLHYDLQFRIDPRRADFEGQASIRARVAVPTQSIVLNAASLELRRIELRSSGRRVPTRHRLRLGAASRGGEASELVLVSDEVISPGEIELVVDYVGRVVTGARASEGLVQAMHANEPYVYASLEAQGARRVFPCFDDPAQRATFSVAIAAPADQVVAAVSPLTRQVADPRLGMVEHEFAVTPSLPTYLVGFTVGPYEVVNDRSHVPPLRALVPRGTSQNANIALEIARASFAALKGYLGQDVPLSKLDIVGVPRALAAQPVFAGMEYPGLIMLDQDAMLNPKRADFRESLTALVTHELAHQWIGNRVGIQWWSDAWLKEGLTDYLTARAVPKLEPWFRKRKFETMLLDSSPGAPSVRRATVRGIEAFDRLTYDKVRGVLEMIATWLGDDAMQRGLQQFVRDHDFRAARAADLFEVLRQASGMNAGPVLRTFLDQPGVPLLDVELACAASGAEPATLRLVQHEFRRAGARYTVPERRWYVPVCVRYATGARIERTCAIVGPQPTSVRLGNLGCPDWIYANDRASGYYVWRMNPAELAKLLPKRSELSEAELAGLRFNVFALAQAGYLDAASAEELGRALQ